MCKCGCNTCETKTKGPLLTEGKVKSLLSEGLQYHIDKKIPLFETVYRIGSDKHLALIKEARKMYSRNVIDLCEDDEALIGTHLGEFALYEGVSVPLDLPMLNEGKAIITFKNDYEVKMNTGEGYDDDFEYFEAGEREQVYILDKNDKRTHVEFGDGTNAFIPSDVISVQEKSLEEAYSGFRRGEPEDPDSEPFNPTGAVAEFKEDLRALFGKFKGDLKNPEFIKGVGEIMVSWKSLLRSQLEEYNTGIYYKDEKTQDKAKDSAKTAMDRVKDMIKKIASEQIEESKPKKGHGEKIAKDVFAKLQGKVVNYKGEEYKVVSSDDAVLRMQDGDGNFKSVNLNQFNIGGMIKEIMETIELGKNLNEELCAKGKAYRKKRMAAGEKSSAYLSGRAVKVCKGQMKG